LDALKNYVQTIRSWEIEPSSGMQYKGPTLFVGGAKSNFIRPEYHEMIRSFFPNAVVEMIPEADHWVHFDKPHEFCRVVAAFLQQTPGH